MPTTLERIENFIRTMRDQVATIESATFARNGNTYKRALLCSLIDSLASTVAPAGGNHRSQGTHVIQTFGGWPSWSRVSLPQLLFLLDRTTDSTFGPVKANVAALAPFPSSALAEITYDPEFASIDLHWPRDPKGKPVAIEGVTHVHLRHDNLFYTLRNKLIHEMLTPATSTVVPGEIQPYYHLSAPDGKADTWVLVYPTAFVVALANKILDGLDAHYRAQQIDPWATFDLGTNWIEVLN